MIADNSQNILPRAEVIRKLRERGEPILLFGELEQDAFKRLRRLEILEPEVNKVNEQLIIKSNFLAKKLIHVCCNLSY